MSIEALPEILVWTLMESSHCVSSSSLSLPRSRICSSFSPRPNRPTPENRRSRHSRPGGIRRTLWDCPHRPASGPSQAAPSNKLACPGAAPYRPKQSARTKKSPQVFESFLTAASCCSKGCDVGRDLQVTHLASRKTRNPLSTGPRLRITRVCCRNRLDPASALSSVRPDLPNRFRAETLSSPRAHRQRNPLRSPWLCVRSSRRGFACVRSVQPSRG